MIFTRIESLPRDDGVRAARINMPKPTLESHDWAKAGKAMM